MKRLVIPALSALLVLSACGGGSRGAAAAPTAETAHQHATATSGVTAAALPSNSVTPASPSPVNNVSPTATSEAARASDRPSASPIAVTVPAPTAGSAVPTAPAAPTYPKPTITMTPSVAPATPALLGKTTVAVRLNDAMTITLSQAAVPEGTVTFNVKNAGSVTHDLIVLKTSLLQNQIPTDPSQPARAQEPGFLGQIANLAPGAETTLTLQLPAGSYVLMCNQPAHYIAGMHAAFAVNGVAAAIDPAK